MSPKPSKTLDRIVMAVCALSIVVMLVGLVARVVYDHKLVGAIALIIASISWPASVLVANYNANRPKTDY